MVTSHLYHQAHHISVSQPESLLKYGHLKKKHIAYKSTSLHLLYVPLMYILRMTDLQACARCLLGSQEGNVAESLRIDRSMV